MKFREDTFSTYHDDDRIAELEAEVAALKHDLERYITIANTETNEAETIRSQLQQAFAAVRAYLDDPQRCEARLCAAFLKAIQTPDPHNTKSESGDSTKSRSGRQ